MQWSPSRRAEPAKTDWLKAKPYAHRGLHGRARPENSRSAFTAAIDADYGIELDVQACRDGCAIVFHDRTLQRMCGSGESLDRLRSDRLAGFRLGSSNEPVPALDEVLRLIDGRAPLLIEIKTRGFGGRRLCRSVAALLADYRGQAAVMSFSAAAIFWFRRHAPDIVRGLVVTEEGRRRSNAFRNLAFSAARPDFLAYDVRSLPSHFAASVRARGTPILSWTVRSEADREVAARHADQIIHELT